MRVLRSLWTHDLALPYAGGEIIDAFFEARVNRLVHQAVIHHHMTHRYEPACG